MTMTTPLMGPAFTPWGRFQLLSLALDNVPPEHAAEVLPLVMSAAIVVIRQVRGERSPAEAYAHVERAWAVVEHVTTPAPPPVENGRTE